MTESRDEGLFVKLYVEWIDNEKLSRAGIAARGIHAAAMCLAKRSDRDGWFPRFSLTKEGASEEQIEECVERNILDADGAYVRPWDWLDRNISQAVIAATRKRSGAIGNHNRWKHPGPFGECPICHKIAEEPLDLGLPPNGVANVASAPKSSPEVEREKTTQSSGLLTQGAADIEIDDVLDQITDHRAGLQPPGRISNVTAWKATTRANLAADIDLVTRVRTAIERYDEPATTIAEYVEGARNARWLTRRAT